MKKRMSGTKVAKRNLEKLKKGDVGCFTKEKYNHRCCVTCPLVKAGVCGKDKAEMIVLLEKYIRRYSRENKRKEFLRAIKNKKEFCVKTINFTIIEELLKLSKVKIGCEKTIDEFINCSFKAGGFKITHSVDTFEYLIWYTPIHYETLPEYNYIDDSFKENKK